MSDYSMGPSCGGWIFIMCLFMVSGYLVISGLIWVVHFLINHLHWS